MRRILTCYLGLEAQRHCLDGLQRCSVQEVYALFCRDNQLILCLVEDSEGMGGSVNENLLSVVVLAFQQMTRMADQIIVVANVDDITEVIFVVGDKRPVLQASILIFIIGQLAVIGDSQNRILCCRNLSRLDDRTTSYRPLDTVLTD